MTRPTTSVLDFGCGFGDLLIYLRSRGCVVLGIDFDHRAASAAAENEIPVHVGPLDTAPIEDGTFDVAVLSHSLEHVPAPEEVLRGLASVLKMGGEMRIAVPNGAATGLAEQKDRWFHLSYPLHFWFFDAAVLTMLLEKCGLDVKDVSYGMTWAAHVRLWRHRISADKWSAIHEALALTIDVLRHPAHRDILRVTAHRVT